MKKLVLFFAAVFMTAVSADVFAQSNDGATPAPGSLFSYKVVDNGNNYAWHVTTADFTDTVPVTVATITEPTADSTGILWGETLTVDDVYYVHVVETEASGCSNEKVLKVTITESTFFLDVATTYTNDTTCYDGAVAVGLDASGEPVYDHGTSTFTYTVTPDGYGNATGYSFSIAEILSKTTGFSSVPSVTSGNGSITAGVVTVSGVEAVDVEVVITNANEYTNSTDATGDSADVKHELTISDGVTNNGLVDNATGTPVKDVTAARPHTTAISFN